MVQNNHCHFRPTKRRKSKNYHFSSLLVTREDPKGENDIRGDKMTVVIPKGFLVKRKEA